MRRTGKSLAILAGASLLFAGQAFAQVDPDPVDDPEVTTEEAATDDVAMDDASMAVVTMNIDLTPDAVRPNPAATEGAGMLTLSVDRGRNLVCYTFGLEGVELASAHIHSGVEGEAGPVTLGLLDQGGALEGCVDADPETIEAILENPGDYYVQGHNADFPAGVVRGQLSTE